MRAPMERMSRTIQRFVDVSGLRKVAQGFEWIGRAAASVLRTMVEIIPVLGTITGAATIAGMVALVKTYTSWSQQLVSTADNLGITTQQLQRFQDATRLAGGNADDMTDALKALYKVQTDFIRGQASAAAIGWLNKLGINVRDASGHLRNMADLMPEVIDKINKLPQPADRAAASAELLGDANAKLIETFRRSSQSFQQWFNDASRYTELSERQKKQLQEFAEAQGRIGTAFDHLGQQLAATLGKNLTPLLNKLSEFVERHSPEIIAAVDRISARFADWLSNVDWSKAEAAIRSIGNAVLLIANNLDTVVIAAEILFGLWAVSKLASIATGFIGIGSAIGGMTTALGARGAAGAVGTGLIGKLGLAAFLMSDVISKWGKLIDPATVPPGSPLETPEQKQRPRPKSLFEQWFGSDPLGDLGDRLLYGPDAIRNAPRPRSEAVPGGAGAFLAGRAGAAPGAMNLPASGLERGAGVRDRLATDLNLSSDAASGIVGNLQAESGLKAIQERNPIGGGRGGFGWAQWTGARRDAFESYAKEHGLDPSSDEANYGFLRKELQSPEYAGMLARMRGKSPQEAAAIFEREFERPAVSNAGVRGAYAGQIAAAPPAAAPAPVAQGGAPPPAAVAQGGAPPAAMPAAPAKPLNGSVDINITHKNPPPNAAVTAQGSGAVNVAPPRVEHQSFASI